MGNIFTKTPYNNFSGLPESREWEKSRMEPNMEVLMFISQFAKVYYVEKQMTRFAFSAPIILN